MGIDDLLVSGHLVVPAVEGGDLPDAGQALGEVRQHVGDPVPDPQVADERDPSEPHGQDDVDRDHGQEADDGQRRVQHHQVGGDHHQGHALHHEVDKAFLHEHRERLDVAGHARHQDAGLLPGEEVQGLALEVAEDPDPELVDEPLAQATGEAGPEPGGDRREANGSYVCQGHGDQHAPVAGHDTVVDADLGEEWPDVEQADLGQHE